ncbi:MAG: hypothetical protein KatS3mg023_0166 [Armatimonadota bacterium]|nr:MAG: hypothetical protein KatS3mg023_0166 [Armatimonadota bacterium]
MRWRWCIISLCAVVVLAGFAWFLWSRTAPITMTQGAVLWGANAVPQPRRSNMSFVSGAAGRGIYILQLDSLEPPRLVYATSGTQPVVFSVDKSTVVVVRDKPQAHAARKPLSSTPRVQHSYLLLDWRTGHTKPIVVPDGELLSLHLGRLLALLRKDAHVFRVQVHVEPSRIVILPTNRRLLSPLPDWAGATLSPKGRYVLIHDRGHGSGGHATVRSASDGMIVTDFAASSAQFLKEGKDWFQVVYTSRGRLFLFDSRGRLPRVLSTDVGNERLVAASPDGRWVVTAFRTADFRELLKGYPYLEHAKLRIRSAEDGKVWRTWTAGNSVGGVVAALSE